MTNPVYELLTAAQNKIRDPKNWTQGGAARNAEGQLIHYNHPEAVCWCSLGAIQNHNSPLRDRLIAANFLEKAMGLSVTIFNDNNPHQAVMAKWDQAREAAKSV